MNKNAKLMMVVGGRGQGKSTYVKAEIRDIERIIVYDPMDEYQELPGFRRAGSLNEVRQIMIDGGAKRYKIAYVPTRGVT